MKAIHRLQLKTAPATVPSSSSAGRKDRKQAKDRMDSMFLQRQPSNDGHIVTMVHWT